MSVQMREGRYPWNTIRAAYVEGLQEENGLRFPTLDELATKYGPDAAHMRRKAAKERWAEQRKMFQSKVEAARQDNKVNLLAAEAAKFDAECLELARVGLHHVRGHFLNAQEKFKSTGGKDAMNVAMLEKLSRASERYQKVGRLALGEPTEHSREDGGPENVITDESIKAAFGALYGSRPGAEGPTE